MPIDEKQKIKIYGIPYNVIISFPLESGFLFRMDLQDHNTGQSVQKIEKPLSAYSMNVVNNLRPFLPLIKEVIFGK